MVIEDCVMCWTMVNVCHTTYELYVDCMWYNVRRLYVVQCTRYIVRLLLSTTSNYLSTNNIYINSFNKEIPNKKHIFNAIYSYIIFVFCLGIISLYNSISILLTIIWYYNISIVLNYLVRYRLYVISSVNHSLNYVKYTAYWINDMEYTSNEIS